MITETFNFLWGTFVALPGWQMTLWVIYTIYSIVMTCIFYHNAKEYGVLRGYKQTTFGNDGYIRLYHIVKIFIDLPMAAIGLFLPALRKTLSFELYRFQTYEEKKIEEEKKKSEAKKV